MSRNPTERFPGPTVTELGTKVTGSGQAGCARVSTPDHAKGQPQPDTGPRSASKIARFATERKSRKEWNGNRKDCFTGPSAATTAQAALTRTHEGRSLSLCRDDVERESSFWRVWHRHTSEQVAVAPGGSFRSLVALFLSPMISSGLCLAAAGTPSVLIQGAYLRLLCAIRREEDENDAGPCSLSQWGWRRSLSPRSRDNERSSVVCRACLCACVCV